MRILALAIALALALTPVGAPGSASAASKITQGVGEDYVPDEFFISVPQLMVSVPVDSKRARMMVVDVMLSTKKQEYAQYLVRVMPRVIDAIHIGLQNGTVAAYDGPNGTNTMKANTLAEVRKATNDTVVADILIKNFRIY